jgi:peptide-methionine (S)-S-oxide reductase
MLVRSIRSILTLGFVALILLCSAGAATKSPIPQAKLDASLTVASESRQRSLPAAVLGTQAVFERVKGVLKATVGYSGGSASTATYDQVTTETTGHAESVEVIYDPSQITYGQLLRVYFSVVHDPTQLNRQGADVGTSYRSAIFYVNEEQKSIATAYIGQLDEEKAFYKPILRQVPPLKGFYRAEEYHQDYALKNPGNPYIMVCERPKIEALKQKFPDLFANYKAKH